MTGFINLWKEEGISSAAAVNRVKRLACVPCGHMGTLDPLAEGILPVGIGNAARLFDYFLGKDKTYLARFRFGATTDTLDREGEVKAGGSIPSAGEILSALPRFTGEIDQIPPVYSAKSVGGTRSYRLARTGKESALAPVRVQVKKFFLTGQPSPDEFEFEIVCGRGTYIRALARDLAAALNTNAYMTALQRTSCGIFTAETSVPLSALNEENFSRYLIPVEETLPFPVFRCSDERLFHGVSLPTELADGDYKLYRGETFYGIARAADGRMKAEKKLC